MKKKLKTLKDIILEPEFESDDGLQIEKQLKDVAREWIRDLDRLEDENKANPFDCGGFDIGEKGYSCTACSEGIGNCIQDGLRDWIRHFFNLEDE